MNSIRRILVAVKDPSARSLPAVVKALQLARAFGAELELFHALDSTLYVNMLEMAEGRLRRSEDDERSQFVQRLERIAARARLHGIRVSVMVEWDYPAYEAIVRRSSRTGADLIVADRHAGRHIAAGWLGLADWELLRLSPVPVLLVKGRRPYRHPTVLAAVDPGQAFSKPAALDPEILRLAGAFSSALRGKLHAIHAYAPVIATLAVTSAGELTRVAESERARVSRRFDQLLQVQATHIPLAQRYLVGGDPSEVIRTTAGRLGTDLVVIGAISRSGLKRLVIGNTAERLLDRLPCDLLVVKPVGFVNRVPRARRGPHRLAAQPSC